MPGVSGRNVKMAFAKFGTNSWGVAASVTKGIYFESDGGLKPNIATVDDPGFGQVYQQVSEVGDFEAPQLSLAQRSRYDDHSYIWEGLAIGSPVAVTIATSAAGQTTSWQHIFNLGDSIDGLGLTLAIDKTQYVDELTSAKVTGFDEEVGDGGVIRETFRVVGAKSTITSSININSTVHGAAYPALGNRVFRKQGTFRMNLQSAAALAAGDAVTAETIKFSFNRGQDMAHVFSQDYVNEPADNDTAIATLEVSYPRMNTVSANSLERGLRDSTVFKADLEFLGVFINSTDKYKKLYQFPHVQLRGDGFEAPVVGPNQVKPKAVFELRMATSSPAGMPFVRPFRLTRIMTNSLIAF